MSQHLLFLRGINVLCPSTIMHYAFWKDHVSHPDLQGCIWQVTYCQSHHPRINLLWKPCHSFNVHQAPDCPPTHPFHLLTTWVSGSHWILHPPSYLAPLCWRCFLGYENSHWLSSNLDLYTPVGCMSPFHEYLLADRYMDGGMVTCSLYAGSAIHSITTFRCGELKVNGVESRKETALTPIFEFHSTMLMNFISANAIFSAYPLLTAAGHTVTILRYFTKVRWKSLCCSPCSNIIRKASTFRLQWMQGGMTYTQNRLDTFAELHVHVLVLFVTHMTML